MNAKTPCFATGPILLMLAVVLLLHSRTASAEPTEELLWPQGAPGALGDEEKDKPKLTIYQPPAGKAGSAAVVICPGGGYGHLAMDHEGHQIAQWLNTLGIVGAIVDYRHRRKGYGHPAPLQDAQRAIRTLRTRAGKLGIKPDRIGILGFSAGGHLASTAATHFDKGDPKSKDPVQQVGCRPDFAVLCYPVISFLEDCTHKGSRRNLLGPEPDAKLVESLSNERQVTSQTPPTFLFHTSEDKGVPAENSILFYQACKKHGVPAELHIFAKGRHGLGLARGVQGTSDWSNRCAVWMRSMGMMDSTK